jgi:surface antigen
MKTILIRNLTLALALTAAPSFASVNYNASKSNTGNVVVADSSHGSSKPAETEPKSVPDGAAKGQATEKTIAPPAQSTTTKQAPDANHGAVTGRRQY